MGIIRKKLVSIIVRLKDEQIYLNALDQILKNQTIKEIEIIAVDNKSIDGSKKHAKKLGWKVISIDDYSPGKALNLGISASKGSIIIILSSHCFPTNKNFLRNYLNLFNKNKNIAGIYGKQVPTKYSNNENARDLIYTFGDSERFHTKDFFFHNANSAIRKSAWAKIKFNEGISHIEDQDWAKKLIKLGFLIVYSPKSIVFHQHGINQHKKSISFRSDPLVNTLKKNNLFKSPAFGTIAYFEKNNFKTLFIIQDNCSQSLIKVLNLNKLDYSTSRNNIRRINHFKNQLSTKISLLMYLNQSLIKSEMYFGVFFDFVQIIGQKANSEDNLNMFRYMKSLEIDLITPITKDHGNYWVYDNHNNLKALNNSLELKTKKQLVYREDLFAGSIFKANFLRSKMQLSKSKKVLYNSSDKKIIYT